jgi:hypothetical protein
MRNLQNLQTQCAGTTYRTHRQIFMHVENTHLRVRRGADAKRYGLQGMAYSRFLHTAQVCVTTLEAAWLAANPSCLCELVAYADIGV